MRSGMLLEFDVFQYALDEPVMAGGEFRENHVRINTEQEPEY